MPVITEVAVRRFPSYLVRKTGFVNSVNDRLFKVVGFLSIQHRFPRSRFLDVTQRVA